MTQHGLEEYLEAAESAARIGGARLQDWVGKFQVTEKGRADLVTDADFAAQKAVKQELLGRFHDHAFLGEERDAELDRDNPFRWIVDPLDGTTNYAHGVPFYSVSIALEIRGELSVGVVYNPVSDECFTAAKGQGARMNGEPIHVSGVANMEQALTSTGLPTDMREKPELVEELIRITATCQSVRRTGSAALNMAFVACGRFDANWSHSLNAWDMAAGVVLIREAGGHATNLDGSPLDIYTLDILATNGTLHSPMMRLLADRPEAK